jgi:hydroxyethylthiazole kinase-like uncharacterized protein yjeF
MYIYDQFVKYVRTVEDKDLAQHLPFPAVDAHKYTRGKAVLIAGSRQYPGAAVMCARATQLSGAGYTELFTAKRNVPLVQVARPSLVVRPSKELKKLRLFSHGNPGAVVFGPGVDESDERAREILDYVIRNVDHPLLIDGGGLAYISGSKLHEALVERGEKGWVTVLTPHFGEANRLGIPFGILPHDDREKMAMQLANCYKAIIVMKGPDTTIANGKYFMTCTEATSALAKAGTGDVLAGFIGGFLAQGVDPLAACSLGVVLHARAGLIAAECVGPISVCADDLLDMFPTATMNLAECLNDEDDAE